jgi:anti-anti-sigma factor
MTNGKHRIREGGCKAASAGAWLHWFPDESRPIMNTATALIGVERQGRTAILTAQGDLRELHCQEIEREQEEILRLLGSNPSIENLAFDFAGTDFFGSTALGMLLRLWRQVRGRRGRMALCNVSPHEADILAETGLGQIWPIHASREAALEDLEQLTRPLVLHPAHQPKG